MISRDSARAKIRRVLNRSSRDRARRLTNIHQVQNVSGGNGESESRIDARCLGVLELSRALLARDAISERRLQAVRPGKFH